MSLTTSQVAARIGKNPYTIARWYHWYENLTATEIQKYKEKGMPELPNYETVGATNWKCWNEKDIDKLIAFSNWVPHTRKGYFTGKGI